MPDIRIRTIDAHAAGEPLRLIIDGFPAVRGRTMLEKREYVRRHHDVLRRALRSPSGPAAFVTGQPAIQHDLDPILASDLRRGELIAVPFALVVLFAIFGLSLAVAIPFVVAACTIAGTLPSNRSGGQCPGPNRMAS
jgi:hypothetical protein